MNKKAQIDNEYLLNIGLRPNCDSCKHSRWVYELRHGLWTCQLHREFKYEGLMVKDKKASVKKAQGFSYQDNNVQMGQPTDQWTTEIDCDKCSKTGPMIATNPHKGRVALEVICPNCSKIKNVRAIINQKTGEYEMEDKKIKVVDEPVGAPIFENQRAAQKRDLDGIVEKKTYKGPRFWKMHEDVNPQGHKTIGPFTEEREGYKDEHKVTQSASLKEAENNDNDFGVCKCHDHNYVAGYCTRCNGKMSNSAKRKYTRDGDPKSKADKQAQTFNKWNHRNFESTDAAESFYTNISNAINSSDPNALSQVAAEGVKILHEENISNYDGKDISLIVETISYLSNNRIDMQEATNRINKILEMGQRERSFDSNVNSLVTPRTSSSLNASELAILQKQDRMLTEAAKQELAKTASMYPQVSIMPASMTGKCQWCPKLRSAVSMDVCGTKCIDGRRIPQAKGFETYRDYLLEGGDPNGEVVCGYKEWLKREVDAYYPGWLEDHIKKMGGEVAGSETNYGNRRMNLDDGERRHLPRYPEEKFIEKQLEERHHFVSKFTTASAKKIAQCIEDEFPEDKSNCQGCGSSKNVKKHSCGRNCCSDCYQKHVADCK